LRTKLTTYAGIADAKSASRTRYISLVAGLAIAAVAMSAGSTVGAEEGSKFGPDALKLYCDGQERYLATIREDEKFGISGTDEKGEWIRARQAENYTQIEKDLGAPFTEWEPLAMTESWGQRCEAIWRGWVTIDEADVKASTSDDAKKVEEALMLFYIKMNDRELFKNFDGRPYTSVNCRSDVFDGFRLTGCTLAGGGFLDGFFSDPMIFMVANKDGHPTFAPLESNTKEHIKLASYGDVEGNPVMTGWYVGPYPLPFNWAEAVKRMGN
jgi:hypothetical protein